MKTRMLACGFVLGVCSALVTSQALSQDSKSPKPGDTKPSAAPKAPAAEEMQGDMAAWMATMNPGEPHKHLKKSAGTWDTVTKIWMGGPQAPPTEIKGTTTMKSVLGDRFILQEHKSQMPFPNEKGEMQMVPWDGMGMFGYDNYQKMYIGCWADTMGTQLLTMKGNLSQDGKTMTMYGQMDEPMLGVIGRFNRYVTHIIDDNTQTFEIYDLHAGENFKVVEVNYKRKK